MSVHLNIDFLNEFDEDINEALAQVGDVVYSLPRPGRFKIMVVDVEPIRSVPQNKYYWMLLTVIEQYTGHDKYELHRIFARIFHVDLRETQNQELLVFGGSTTALRRKAFFQYCEKIRLFALYMMGVSEDQFDEAIPPRDRVTEEMLWNAGIYPPPKLVED